MKRRAPASGIFFLCLTLIAVLAAATVIRRSPTVHADALPFRLHLPIVHVHPPPPPARTLHVPADHPTVADALAVARAGDVVQLAAGDFHEYGLEVPDGVTVRGAGWRETTLWKSGQGREPGKLPFVLALGSHTTIEGVQIGSDDEQIVGISIHRSGRHTIRDVLIVQTAIGINAGCRSEPGCVAYVEVSRTLFLHCFTALNTDADTALVADHLTIRAADVGARILRPASRLTNTLFDGVDTGIEMGQPGPDGPGIVAHHNLFSDVAQPNATWLEPGDGDIVVPDALLAPMEWWLTALSPARHAASDGSDIGAIPFAGIGTPPTGLRIERGPAPSPGAARPWVVSWDPVPDAWIYHVAATPVDGGPATLGYTYAGAAGQDRGTSMVMDRLAPGRAHRVVVSTAYFALGESEASEAVLLPAGDGR